MNLALWIIPGLLAVVFLASGAMQLIQARRHGRRRAAGQRAAMRDTR